MLLRASTLAFSGKLQLGMLCAEGAIISFVNKMSSFSLMRLLYGSFSGTWTIKQQSWYVHCPRGGQKNSSWLSYWARHLKRVVRVVDDRLVIKEAQNNH